MDTNKIIQDIKNEKEKIENMMKSYDKLILDDIWYVISKDWFQKWKSFDGSPDCSPPGPIDNSNLIEHQEFADSENEIDDDIIMRDGLEENDHYDILPKAVYRILKNNYGGGPDIKRSVIYFNSQLIIELQPFKFHIYVQSDAEVKTNTIKPQFMLTCSKTQSLNLLYEKIASHLNIKNDPKSFRIWYRSHHQRPRSQESNSRATNNNNSNIHGYIGDDASLETEQKLYAQSIFPGHRCMLTDVTDVDVEGGSWRFSREDPKTTSLLNFLKSSKELDILVELAIMDPESSTSSSGSLPAYQTLTSALSTALIWPRDVVLNKWRESLQSGDMVDTVDSEKRWFEAEITEITEKEITVHYMGWSEIFDKKILKSEMHRMIQPLYSQVTDWRSSLTLGSLIEIKDGQSWFIGMITEFLTNENNIELPTTENDSSNSTVNAATATSTANSKNLIRVILPLCKANVYPLPPKHIRLVDLFSNDICNPGTHMKNCNLDEYRHHTMKSVQNSASLVLHSSTNGSSTTSANLPKFTTFDNSKSSYITKINTSSSSTNSTSAVTATASNTSKSYLFSDNTNSSSSTISGSGWFSSRPHTKGTPVSPGCVGLSNLGNTCFMASMLQCLSHTRLLTEGFISDDYKQDLNPNNALGHGGKLAIVYAKLLKDIWSGNYVVVVPDEFKRTIGDFAAQFAGYQQQDSQEFMCFLLDGLHEDCNRIQKKPYVAKIESKGRPDSLVAVESWRRFLLRNDSLIVDNCYGQLKSHVTCTGCGKESVTFEAYNNLSLPIPTLNTKRIHVVIYPLPYGSKPLEVTLDLLKSAAIADLKLKLSEYLHQYYSSLTTTATATASDSMDSDSDKPITATVAIHDTNTSTSSIDTSKDNNNPEIDDDATSTSEDAGHTSAETPSEAKTTNPMEVEEEEDGFEIIRKENGIDPLGGDEVKDPLSAEGVSPVSSTGTSSSGYVMVSSSEVTNGSSAAATSNDSDFDITDSEDETASSTTRTTGNKNIKCNGHLPPHLPAPPVKKTNSNNNYNKMDIEETVTPTPPNPTTTAAPTMAKTRHYYTSTAYERDATYHIMKTVEDSYLLQEIRLGDTVLIFETAHAIPQPISYNYSYNSKPASYSSSSQYTSTTATATATATATSKLTVVGIDVLMGVMRKPQYYTSLNASFHQIGQTRKISILSKKANISSNINSSFYRNKDVEEEEDEEDEQPEAQTEKPTTRRDLHKIVFSLMKPMIKKSPANGSVNFDDDNVNLEDVLPYRLYVQGAYGPPKELLVLDDVAYNSKDALVCVWKEGSTEEEFFDDSFHIPIKLNDPTSNPVQKSQLTIQSCLNKFTEREQLTAEQTLYCSQCKQHLAPIKKFDIWTAPNVLILHLKRFQYIPGQYFVHREKISEVIDFPLEGLDLSEFVKGLSPASSPPIYDLFAVSEHSGGLGGGHYTAMCKNIITGKWYDFNDSSVSEANSASAVSSQSYVLFYQRRNPVGRWAGVSLPSTTGLEDEVEED